MMKKLRIAQTTMLLLIIAVYVAFGFVVLLGAKNCVVEAEDFGEKIYPSINIEDNFVDNTVIIVLDKEETFKFRDYTEKDFQEVGCIAVMNLMENTEKIVKMQLKAKETKNWKELELKE